MIPGMADRPPPRNPAGAAASELAAPLAGRKLSPTLLAALAIVAILLVATAVALFDASRARRAGDRPAVISPPHQPEHPAPAAIPPAEGPLDNARAATEWYLARATEGDAGAQYELALRYAKGDGAIQDYARAAAWFREAAINGVAAAQYDLGILYEHGLGLARDAVEAVIWYQSAADQNEPVAQLRLGTLYLAGEVVPRNAEEAARWLRRAAEQGVAEAQAMLAARYEAGDGVAGSNDIAYGWYSLAAEAGLAEAQHAKARLARDFSPEALNEAESHYSRLAARLPRHLTAVARQDADGLLLTPTPAGSPVPGATSPIAASPITGSPVLVSRGIIGEIQRLLGAGGYDPGPADGLLGEQTVAAIKRYQQDVGLPVDGSPGITLLNRLRAAAAGPPPAAQP